MCFGVLREVVLAADDVGDPHRGVVHHHGEVVERRPVGPDDDEVAAEGGRVDLDVAPDQVVEGDDAGLDPEADRRPTTLGLAGGPLVGGQRRAAADVAGRLLRRLLRLPVGVELLGRAVARVGPVLRDEPRRRLRVERQARHLAVGAVGAALLAAAGRRALVPLESQPVEVLQDVALERHRGAGLVGVLEAQDEGAADVAGVEVVEERRAGGPDVEGAGGAGRDADAGLGHGASLGPGRPARVGSDRPGSGAAGQGRERPPRPPGRSGPADALGDAVEERRVRLAPQDVDEARRAEAQRRPADRALEGHRVERLPSERGS